MKNNLLFNFGINTENNTVNVEREFAADLNVVWEAWTNPEILDQWWAPLPWKSKTKFMDFKVGGRRFYAMVSPQGQEHWALQEFTSIGQKTNFKIMNSFADKDENPELPGSEWDLHFSEQNGVTRINISIYNESVTRMERMIEMGFTDGFTTSLNQLDNFFSTIKN
jgi:uncharacterized protein YndB with AHSA1/START domain